MKQVQLGAPPVYDSAAAQFQALVELQELWRYRGLVRNLVARDLKVRYKRSALGFIWVTVSPLLTTIVLTVAFSFLFGKTQPLYPLFVLGGLLIWNVFAQGSIAAMSNLIGNGGTLRRMYIPPSVFVVSSIGSALVNLVLTLGPFYVIALVYAFIKGAPLSFTWLYVLVVCVQVTMFTLGVGLIISTAMVFFNDVAELYNVGLTAYNYLTPVFYPITILPAFVAQLEGYNPMYLYVSAAQHAVVGATQKITLANGQVLYHTLLPFLPDFKTQLVSWGAALLVFAIGWLLFTRMEDRFAYHF